jgi:hypothetical protein
MNLDARLREFKQFENDDGASWDKVIGGEEPEVPQRGLDGSARLAPKSSSRAKSWIPRGKKISRQLKTRRSSQTSANV